MNKCRCGKELPKVKDTETPYEFCSSQCKEKSMTQAKHPIRLQVMHKVNGNRLIGDGAYGFITVDQICDGKNGCHNMDDIACFIVKAADCHDDLLEALEEMASPKRTDCNDRNCGKCSRCKTIKAIAKARRRHD